MYGAENEEEDVEYSKNLIGWYEYDHPDSKYINNWYNTNSPIAMVLRRLIKKDSFILTQRAKYIDSH